MESNGSKSFIQNAIGGGLNTLYVLVLLFYLKFKLSKIDALSLLYIISLFDKKIYYNMNNIPYKNREIKNIELVPNKYLEKNPLIIKENDLESIDMRERNNKVSKYINYKKMLLLKENKESDDMRLVEYINDKYKGVHIYNSATHMTSGKFIKLATCHVGGTLKIASFINT